MLTLLPQASINDDWGIDHGTWTVLSHMFPGAPIPVVQLSIDGTAGPKAVYDIGKALAPLREEGYLLFGSGNIVHNLYKVEWENEKGSPAAGRFRLDAFGFISRNSMAMISGLRPLSPFWRRQAPTSPAERYYLTPWAEPSNRPEGGADPGQNPWCPGPKTRRRHQPSRRSRVNLREYRQAPIPPQKPMASSIAHSKKHRSSDWCFFIIPVHAGLHGRHGHVLRDVRPPLPLQI